jgi:hypothetical protein
VVGCAAGRDQDIFCSDALAGRKTQCVRVLQRGAGLDDCRTGLLDIERIRREPRDFLVLVGNQRGPVEGRFGMVQPKPAASSSSWRTWDA